MKVALVQERVSPRGPDNFDTVIAHLEQAAGAGVDLVVFPECFLTGYVYHSRAEVNDHAVALEDDGWRRILTACRDTGLHVICGFLQRDGGRIYNAAALAGPGGIIGVHRKSHLPLMGADRFVDLPLNEPLTVFHTDIGAIGICICYELRFPEVARTLALQGADLIAVPTNWIAKSRLLAEAFAQVRAAENRVFLVTANRNDTDGDHAFMGASRLFSPNGEELLFAGTASGLHAADIDLTAARDKRIIFTAGTHEVDTFNDRRPDIYLL